MTKVKASEKTKDQRQEEIASMFTVSAKAPVNQKSSKWSTRELNEQELATVRPFDGASIILQFNNGYKLELERISLDNSRVISGDNRSFISIIDSRFPKRTNLKYKSLGLAIRNTINLE